MSIKSSDIAFYYSGQSSSLGIPDSIGGEPSTIPVADRLFKNITNQEATDGIVDYKCVYMANKNPDEPFYNLNLTIKNSSTSVIQFGFPGVHSTSTELCSIPPCTDSTIQYLNLVASGNKINGGGFSLIYNGSSEPIELGIQWSWSNSLSDSQNLSNTANNIKAALELIPEFKNVIIEPQASTIPEPGKYKASFKIIFETGRYVDLLTVPSYGNALSPATVVTVYSAGIGGPVNRTADVIETSRVAPNITFLDVNSTVIIKHFYPNDYIPIWIKRTILPNTAAVDQDNFSILISASNSEIEPTPTPTYVALDLVDQSQELYDGGLQVIPGIAYWQSFDCTKTGVLSQLEIGLYSDPISSNFSTNSTGDIIQGSVSQTSFTAVSGTGTIRVYTGEGINSSNLIASSVVSVNVANSLITWNNFKINVDIIKNIKYTLAYTPDFIHKIAINYQNPYNGGIFGVNTTSFPEADILFKTHVLEEFSPPTPTPTMTPSLTPTLTPTFTF